MREAHAHLFALGEALSLESLDSCASVGECLDRVRAAAARAHTSDAPAFIRLTGARVAAWPEARWPTISELNAAAGGPGCPVVIMSFDHHQAAANTEALRRAELLNANEVPPKGIVERDPHTLEPTGVLHEHAAYRAWDAAYRHVGPDRTSMVSLALRHLASLGFSEVHDLHSQPWLGPTLAGLHDSADWPVPRVWLYPPVDAIEEAAAGRYGWERGPDLALAGGKVFADGTLSSGTALMIHPYLDPIDPVWPRGRAMVTKEELREAIELTGRLGVGLAVHAIGDGAVRMVLDSWEGSGRAGREWNRGAPPPLRIEHCEVIDEADVPRFASLGVVCSVQPCHLLTDIEVLRRHLPHRCNRVLPLRELIMSGCAPGPDGLLWFGSDVPIVRADPGDSLLAATSRRRSGMPAGEAVAPEQAISKAEAREAFRPRGAPPCPALRPGL